jgi:putative ABC transporter-associated repeat protein
VILTTTSSTIAAVIAGTLLIGSLGATPDLTPAVPPSSDDIYVPNASLTTSGATILNDGHIDIASLIEGDALVTKVKDTSEGSQPVWREPEETVLQLLPESKTAVPSDPAFGFLGEPGSPVWQVTQTQQDDLLWPGWSTEALPLSATNGGVAWKLTDVEGYPDATGAPSAVGDFALYELGTFGAVTVLFDSTDPQRSSFTIPKNVHAHGTWSFTAEGTYCMSFTRSAQSPTGAALSDEFVVAVAVGAVAVRAIDPAKCFSPSEPDPSTPTVPEEPTTPETPDTPETPETPDTPDTPDIPPVPPVPPVPAPASTTVAASQCVAGATILSSGHVDYASRIVNGKLESLIKDGTTQTTAWREPSGTIVWLKPSSKVVLPPGYGAIGAAGTAVWQVPQTQNADLVWLGWNSEELSAAQVTGPVSWTLDSVSGPGAVKVYLQGSFGEVKELVFDGGGTHSIPLGKHVHGNWAFAAEGVYRLSFTQAVTLAGGARSSDTETLTVAVGAVDPRTAVSRGSGCGAIAAAAPTRAAAADADALAALAAAQAAAQAAAAPDAGERERPSKPGSRAAASVERPASSTTAAGGPVQILLFVLGGLLVLGAAGGAVLWSRSRGPAAAVPGE